MKVSIITVCFNSAETIEDTIKSVQSQDYQNIEYIIVDGGSRDATLEILTKYRSRISTFISEPDDGVYDAMNKGIKLSTGDVIAILNSDDIYADETVVGQMVEFMQNNGLDAAYGDLVYIDHNNTDHVTRFWKAGEYKKGAFCHGWVLPHPTFFCRKEIFERFGYFNDKLQIAADFELMLRFIEKHRINVGYLPEVIVKMRIGGRANVFRGVIRGNWEIIRSFRLNNLHLSPWFFVRKPIAKISQLFRRPSKLNDENIGLCKFRTFKMPMQVILFFTNIIVINVAFLLSFLFRYGLPFPERSFLPYKNSFVFLTLIYMSALAFFQMYKSRFKSSWDLFKRVFLGVFLGTLLSIAFVYVFRIKWGAFPTSVFTLSFFVNLVLIFKLNQFILKAKKRIRKKVVILGVGNIDDFVTKKTDVERKRIGEIEELSRYTDIDEVIICDKIQNGKNLNLLLYLVQKLKINVVFDPSSYLALLPERINGNNCIHFLNTFVGKKPDVEEFLIRSLDIIGSILILLISMPVTILISLLIKISSLGPVLYKQQRVGRDGKIFILYKFRTMVKDAEKIAGPILASRDDPRVTKVGKVLRRARLDELPQLFNVLRGDMSLVGPRPERPHFARLHGALRELRLAVRPGLTGLAQIRNFYDLKPQHKIKYDYLYIQRRSLLLNIYILLKTVPVIFCEKGW